MAYPCTCQVKGKGLNMLWSTQGPSKRSLELPPGWPAIRRRVITRDHGRCTARMDSGAQCPEVGTDVDHIGDPHDHSLANLHLLCGWHHRAKTGRQGAEATARQHAKLRHPGITRTWTGGTTPPTPLGA